jgi:hypothetical protein
MQLAWVVTGVFVMASGLASLMAAWQGVLLDPRWSAVAEAVLRGGSVALSAAAHAADSEVAALLLYVALSMAMAIAWFGAIVVPRHAQHVVRSRT